MSLCSRRAPFIIPHGKSCASKLRPSQWDGMFVNLNGNIIRACYFKVFSGKTCSTVFKIQSTRYCPLNRCHLLSHLFAFNPPVTHVFMSHPPAKTVINTKWSGKLICCCCCHPHNGRYIYMFFDYLRLQFIMGPCFFPWHIFTQALVVFVSSKYQVYTYVKS